MRVTKQTIATTCITVLSLTVITAALFLVARGKNSNTTPSQLPQRPPVTELRKTRDANLRALPLCNIDQSNLLDTLNREIVAKLDVLRAKGNKGEQLAKILQSQLISRSTGVAEDLISLFEKNDGKWLGPDEDEQTWKVLAGGYQEVSGKPLRRNDPADVLRVLYENDLKTGCAQVAKVPCASGALRIHAGNATDPNSVLRPNEMTGDERDLWQGFGTARSFLLRRPRQSLETTLQNQRMVTYVQLWITLESACDNRYVWFSSWFWNEQLQTWCIGASAILGGDSPHGWRM